MNNIFSRINDTVFRVTDIRRSRSTTRRFFRARVIRFVVDLTSKQKQ